MKHSTFLIALIILASCRSYIPIGTHTVETVTYRDTTVVIKQDSALLTAYLECDSAGNVLLKEVDRLSNDRIGLDMRLDKGVLKIVGTTTPTPIKIKIPEKLIVKTEDKIIYKSQWYDIMCRWIAVFFVLLIIYRFRFLIK